MLSLNRQTCKIDNVNVRAEKHGQDTKVAIDLHLSCTVSNDVLDHFDSQLKGALFTKGDSPQGDLLPDDARLTGLRFSKLDAVKWDEEFPGYTLALHVGINDDSDIPLDAKLDKFAFDPKEGGSVAMRFRAVVHPASEQLGPLCELIQRDVEVTATPPLPAVEIKVVDGSTGADPADPRGVLVIGLEVEYMHGTHLYVVRASLSDGSEPVVAGEWAYRPTLDEIAGGIFDLLQKSVEFAPACRSDYNAET